MTLMTVTVDEDDDRRMHETSVTTCVRPVDYFKGLQLEAATVFSN